MGAALDSHGRYLSAVTGTEEGSQVDAPTPGRCPLEQFLFRGPRRGQEGALSLLLGAAGNEPPVWTCKVQTPAESGLLEPERACGL